MHPLLASKSSPLRAITLVLALACAPLSAFALAPLKERTPSSQFKAACEARLSPSRVTVVSLPSEVVYDFTSSSWSLTARSTHHHAKNSNTLGLTEARFRVSLNFESTRLEDPVTGLSCVRPGVTATVQVGPQTVSIAKEFPNGTCAFNEIAKHELRHVNVNQKHAEIVADRLSEELKKQFGNKIYYGDGAELQALFVETLQSAWIPWALELFKKSEADHDAIDTKEEYARNNVICGGIVPRVLGARTPMPLPP